MRTAPPIRTVASANRPWQAAVCVLAVVSGLTVAAWLSSPTVAGWGLSLGIRWFIGAVVLAWAAWAVRMELRPAAIDLQWDGQAWWWQGPGMPDPQPCHPQVVADFDGWMLLRCAPQAGAAGRRWLALQRHAGTALQWHALRCALHTSRSPG